MRLTTAHVTNFKLVEDSNEFSVDDVTCLVGKNEAGKTAVLQALYRLNPVVAADEQFEPLDYPRRKYTDFDERTESEDNIVTTTWELGQGDIETVEDVLGPGTVKSPSITVTKGYDNVRNWTIGLNEKALVSNLLKESELDGGEGRRSRCGDGARPTDSAGSRR